MHSNGPSDDPVSLLDHGLHSISLGTASTVDRRHLGATRSSFESSRIFRIAVGRRRHSPRARS